MKQNYTILGRDRLDAEVQRDRWLLENPDIRVLRLHPPQPEPRTLLTRIGGRDVPRVSIEVEYEYESMMRKSVASGDDPMGV